jgi:hypothetical protein
MDEARRRSIEYFVRETLGCGCPEEVFRSIVVDRAEAPDGSTPFTRIAVGDRLLVYVVRPGRGCAPEAVIAPLARLGRGERDRKGFNRFRLVVVSDDIQPAAADRFREVVGPDVKAHIHVIPPGELPRPLR